MANAFKPGDVSIRTISITSLDGTRTFDNIIAQVMEFSIYSSILSPMMTATFNMYDGIGLLSTFPIIGEERITLSFETPGQDFQTFVFRVVSIINRTHTGMEGKGVGYTLYCVSDEYSNNSLMVNKIYRSQTSQYVINDILMNILKTKKTFTCTESGLSSFDLDVLTLNPFKAIDKARMLQYSSKNPASSFCFYETPSGFTLQSIESMMSPSKTIKEYAFDTAPLIDISNNRDYRTVLSWKVLSDSNIGPAIQKGLLNNEMRTFDILTGGYTIKSYTEANQGQNTKKVDPKGVGLVSSSTVSTYGTNPAKTMMNIIDSSAADPNVQEFLMERSAFIHKMTQQIFLARIWGDMDVDAGDILDFNMPTMTGLTGELKDEQDRRFDGNVLVSKVKQRVMVAGSRPTHFTTLELLKGSFS